MSEPSLTDGTVTLVADPGQPGAFDVDADGEVVGRVSVRRTEPTTGALTWALLDGHRGQGHATRSVRLLVAHALAAGADGGLGLSRVEARVDAGDEAALRVATRSGMLREGVRRAVPEDGSPDAYVVLSRLVSDPSLDEPGAFRSLLNSFLPRKRAIAQLLVRDTAGRVLLCGLTYKTDWDLPGGVVEVGESPQLAAGREVVEELALDIVPGRLLLTDWLPPWGGWDDAVCLVFDGGVHDAAVLDDVVKQAREIRDVRFCTPTEVRERCADFTARRVEAALAVVAAPGDAASYTESGRPAG